MTNSDKNDILNLSLGKADFLCQTRPRVCVASLTDFPNDRRNGAFLLEVVMPKGVYKRNKPPFCAREFKRKWNRENRDKVNEYRRRYFKKYPWVRFKWHITSKCSFNPYYNGEIKKRKDLISVQEVKTLWFRDNAELMKKPSIDRINNDGDYTFDNCRFVERGENTRLSNVNRKRDKSGKFLPEERRT